MYHALSFAAEPLGTPAPAERRWSCDDVIALIAREKRVPIRLLSHSSRCQAQAARARQLAMYLSHTALGRTLTEVGAAFGRDRTTVSYACALIEDLRDDRAFDAEVTALEEQISLIPVASHV
jgi:chromosomal replication initiation ATPase DnaA